MKKLIATLFAVAIAYGANAAAVTWGFDGYYEDVNYEPLQGMLQVYLNDTLISTMSIVDGVAQDSFDVDTGTLKIVATVTNFADGAGTTEWEYLISAIPMPGYPDAASTLSAIQGYIEQGVTHDYSIDISQTVADNGYSPVGPTPPVIPEPTTGLLVLIGVAGLALRRRA